MFRTQPNPIPPMTSYTIRSVRLVEGLIMLSNPDETARSAAPAMTVYLAIPVRYWSAHSISTL